MDWNGRGGGIRTPDPLLPKQMRYQAALRPDASIVAQRRLPSTSAQKRATPRTSTRNRCHHMRIERGTTPSVRPQIAPRGCYNQSWYGGYSSAAERLTVAQDVVGSIPTSRPRSAWWIAYATPLQ